MSRKLPYTRPQLRRHKSQADYPAWTRDAVKALRQEIDIAASDAPDVTPQFVTVVDADRRYVEVSDSFCKLVGYSRDELIGKQYDALTAPHTSDIPTIFNLFSKLGYMHGLWMLVSKGGTLILVRYKSWLRHDSYIEGHMELVGAGY